MASGDCIFLTGATGFVGSHILRELLGAGYEVRALRRSSDTRHSPDVEWIEGDLRNVGAFARTLDGCRALVHCAALYSFAPRDRAEIHAVNVDATASLLLAADLAGVERVVLTSSSATEDHAENGYHRSKLEQERAAFSARVPVIALLPTAPVGPGDRKPTPTGKLVLDFARGKIVAKAPGNGGMNLVAVEDVARAHVAALQGGRTGERYIVGGENLSMDEIWRMLSEITGRPMPAMRAPYALALAAGYLDDLRCRITGSTPTVPLEGVRLSRERMYADSSKAARDLGYVATSVRAALERAVAWFRDHATASEPIRSVR
ncbi:MAG TPA: NAD-dependent epimerase/dehydratase family protein [Candidatus Cybelea sp.]|jgi:dihydroflavonol-4-reductase|nr:NAD-dependent epimerase/dehydratase family protein [Candidatus Cybelea sp.]